MVISGELPFALTQANRPLMLGFAASSTLMPFNIHLKLPSWHFSRYAKDSDSIGEGAS